MDFNPYARRPFVIEAARVTAENMEEIANLGVGTIKTNQKGTRYIQVNRMIVPHTNRVYPGFWFTKTPEGTIRFYNRHVFERQFTPLDADSNRDLGPYIRPTERASSETVHSNVFVNPPDSPEEAVIAPPETKPIEDVAPRTKSEEELLAERKAEIADKTQEPDGIPKGGTYDPDHILKANRGNVPENPGGDISAE